MGSSELDVSAIQEFNGSLIKSSLCTKKKRWLEKSELNGKDLEALARLLLGMANNSLSVR